MVTIIARVVLIFIPFLFSVVVTKCQKPVCNKFILGEKLTLNRLPCQAFSMFAKYGQLLLLGELV